MSSTEIFEPSVTTPAAPLAEPKIAESGVELFHWAFVVPFHQLARLRLFHVPDPSCGPVAPGFASHVRLAA
jgi:hypothetical protein